MYKRDSRIVRGILANVKYLKALIHKGLRGFKVSFKLFAKHEFMEELTR